MVAELVSFLPDRYWLRSYPYLPRPRARNGATWFCSSGISGWSTQSHSTKFRHGNLTGHADAQAESRDVWSHTGRQATQ